jgi:hypothetical protein
LHSCASLPHEVAHFACDPIAVTDERQHTSPCAQSAVSSHSISADFMSIVHVPGSAHEYMNMLPLTVMQHEKPLIEGQDAFPQSICPGVEVKF